MNSKRRKAIMVIIAVITLIGYQFTPIATNFGVENQAYGKGLSVTSKLTKAVSAMQGDQNVIVTIDIENLDNADFTFDSATLSFDDPRDIAVSGGSSGTVKLAKNQKTSIVYYLNINRYATNGARALQLTLKNGATIVHENYILGKLTIFEKTMSTNNGSGNQVAAMELVHSIKPTSGLETGQGNILTLEIFNNGSTVIKNAQITLTLPDGISIYNASNSLNLGNISTGKSAEASFPIEVSSDAAKKSYAITAELTGLSYSDAAVSLKKNFYIPVNGAGTSVKNVAITNINSPDQVLGDEEFNLSFQVQNLNNSELKNIKVSVDVPEGLLNKSRIVFVESSIPANETKNYSVKLFAADSAKEKAYPIKISVDSSTSTTSTDTVMQYASVYVKAASGTSKTPQLMVDSYDYGGTYVQAGDEFLLDLGLYNTSKTHNLTNIKVTLTSEEGNFVPVNSSNSFFIDEIAKKKRASKTMCFAVKPNAEQKTIALTVDMAYEDGAGNPFTSKDVISIPVMQSTKLEVDDIVAPPDLFALMQTGISVQFYNTGKTVLNNLRVTAEGDFDTMESVSYFAGNLESGKSDSYDFSFIPRKAGPMEGKIIFTYEDASGEVQIFEKPFSFEVMEEMPMPEDGEFPTEENGTGKSKLPWILGGIAVVIGGGGGMFGWKKFKKKKINQEMEIDE